MTVRNVNKTVNKKDDIDNSQKKTEKHFKNVRELKDISNTDKKTKQTNVLGKKEPLKTDKTENVGDNTKEDYSENSKKKLKGFKYRQRNLWINGEQ